jgi:uncharacterized protein
VRAVFVDLGVCHSRELTPHGCFDPIISSFFIKMARKKAQRKQETTLVPHRTSNLSVLLQTAKTGDLAAAVDAFLSAGGLPSAIVEQQGVAGVLRVPLLHAMARFNAHPHRELSQSVALLVAAGADINTVATYAEGKTSTALVCACERDCCTKVLAAFLQAGADACVHHPGSLTALQVAAVTGLAASCTLLLESEHSLLHMTDQKGYTALMLAASFGVLENVQLLVQHGADVNAVNNQRETALMLACLQNRVKVVVFLLKRGAAVNAVADNGQVALFGAVQSNSVAAVQLLLDHGADISFTDSTGRNVLFKAAHDDNVFMMDVLVKRGLSVNSAESSGNTVLIAAVTGGHTAAVEWLIQRGAAVNASNSFGSTVLHVACAEGVDVDSVDATTSMISMSELLLSNGADVHKCSELGRTALHLIADYGYLECAKVLIAAGADVNHLDNDGVASLHLAVGKHNSAVVQLLLQHGATAVMNRVLDVKCVHGEHCCTAGMTPLMMCNEIDTVKLLLAAGADVHVTNEAGDTCLHVAARHDSRAPVLCLLIKAGADLHAVNNESETAAQLAHDRGHKLVELLLLRAAEQAD